MILVKCTTVLSKRSLSVENIENRFTVCHTADYRHYFYSWKNKKKKTACKEIFHFFSERFYFILFDFDCYSSVHIS